MNRFLLPILAVSGLVAGATAQSTSPRRPVIDLHVHGTNTTPQVLRERMDGLNLRYALVQILAPESHSWRASLDSSSYLPALGFPCPGGRAPFVDRRCWEGTADLPDPDWLREELRSGRVKALGELVPQLFGILPNDPRLEPYWQLAEEFDIPVGIHMGHGPPGAAYESSPSPVKFPEHRASAGDPLLLEDVLLRHKRLRLLVMHAGWPRLESMIALLYAHPNVYVDLGGLQAPFTVPRPSFYAYLRGLVDAGFGKRIVFGSDLPNQVESGISAIAAADFLSEVQKADILCGNAARFLRLDESTCAP